MQRGFKHIITLISVFLVTVVNAQVLVPGEIPPKGAIVYSLPATSFRVVAEARHESFVAGPYAKFAQKYLGIQVRESSGEFYTLSSVELFSYIEADPAINIALNLGNTARATANFFEMLSQGVVVWSDASPGRKDYVRFPTPKDQSLFNVNMATSNLTTVSTTLFRTVSKATGLERVPVQQSQVVEKSLEKRAEEAANTIFKLRTKRLEIITGETDATFSGEALKSAIDEINRLEAEYLSLFLGNSTFDNQKFYYDVVPNSENPRQIYIAFRISDSQGLLPADNVSGRPVIIELLKENGQSASSYGGDLQVEKGRILYRVPEIMQARISDGQNILLQTRVPVYQFGRILSFPTDLAFGK